MKNKALQQERKTGNSSDIIPYNSKKSILNKINELQENQALL